MDNCRSDVLTRFRGDSRGSISTMFALSAIPFVIALGAAIDYSRAASKRDAVNRAADAAVLAGAQIAGSTNDASLLQYVQNYFRDTLGDSRGKVDSLWISPGRTELKLCASLVYDTAFVKIAGVDDFVVSNQPCSSAKISNGTMEIALVLDNSGSMSDSSGGKSKLKAAQDAAKQLVSTIMSNPVAIERTKISVVPFTLSVNVGSQYATSTWIDRLGTSSIHWQNIDKPASATSRFDLYTQLGENWNGCVETRPGTFATSDSAPNTAVPDSLYVPMFAPDEPGNKKAGEYDDKDVDNSYINDDGEGACTGSPELETPDNDEFLSRQKRGCKYAINGSKNKKSISGTNGASRGPNKNCQTIPLLRMTNVVADINAKIDAMKADGNTNLFEGFAWGWRTVSPNGPFADGKAYTWSDLDKPNRKIIVLMTDGDNVWSAKDNPNGSIYSPMGFYRNERLGRTISSGSQATDALDAKTLETCNNAKAQLGYNGQPNVTVYTIAFSAGNSKISTKGQNLLKGCASSPQHYYLATSSDQLLAVFNEIARDIGRLRLTQ